MPFDYYDYDGEVHALTPQFYAAYPSDQYPELLQKNNRPYNCLLVKTNVDYFICIPFRSSMKHNCGFHFSNTHRATRSRSGLDFKKIVLVKNAAFIDDDIAVIDRDEFLEARANLKKIAENAATYVNRYVQHITKARVLHPHEYERKYRYSTLPYFHDILGCETVNGGSENATGDTPTDNTLTPPTVPALEPTPAPPTVVEGESSSVGKENGGDAAPSEMLPMAPVE